MKELLRLPALYQAYQELGGFFSARVKALREYSPIAPGMRVIDIGCGPGYIVSHLPQPIDYIGFDIDEASIAHAQAKFGHLGRFVCGFFDAASVAKYGPVDMVMMNGVLHHIADAELAETLSQVKAVLKEDGVLLTLDGVYVPGQSRISKWLLDNDRGHHVRDAQGYRSLLSTQFPMVEMHLRNDYSRLPYDFAIAVARKSGDAGAAGVARKSEATG